MSTVDYSPEELAHIKERDTSVAQAVATAPEPKAVTKKTNTVKDTNPTTSASVSDVTDPSAAPVDYGSMVGNVVSGYKDVKEKAPSVLESLDTSMPWLKYAVGTLGILGAGAAAMRGGEEKKPSTPIKDRSIIRVDPEMDVSRRMPDGRIEPTMTNAGEPRMVGGLFPADVSTKEVGGPPKDMPLVEASAANKAKNQQASDLIAKGQPVKPKGEITPLPAKPSLMTGSGMPAYQGTAPEGSKVGSSMSSLDKVPKDKVFVPEGQYMDIVRNATGQEAYTANLKKHGYPPTPEAGYATGAQINRDLGRMTREEAKAAGVSLGEPTKGITQKVAGIKTVRVAGVAGALISLTDLAKADSLRQGLGDVAEGLLPIGMTPTTAGAPVVPPSRFTEATKLGSPYYNTEWAKKQRAR